MANGVPLSAVASPRPAAGLVVRLASRAALRGCSYAARSLRAGFRCERAADHRAVVCEGVWVLSDEAGKCSAADEGLVSSVWIVWARS